MHSWAVRKVLFSFWLRFSGFVWVRIPLMLMSTLWPKLLFSLSCLETERFSFFRFFFFINMYIYIYLEFITFCFSSSFRDWTLQHFQVEKDWDARWWEKTVPLDSSSSFFQNISVDSSSRGPAALGGVTLQVVQRDCERIAVTVLSWGLKKHIESNQTGNMKPAFGSFVLFDHSGSAMGPKLKKGGRQRVGKTSERHGRKEGEYWSWTGSHVTSHRKPTSLP